MRAREKVVNPRRFAEAINFACCLFALIVLFILATVPAVLFLMITVVCAAIRWVYIKVMDQCSKMF